MRSFYYDDDPMQDSFICRIDSKLKNEVMSKV